MDVEPIIGPVMPAPKQALRGSAGVADYVWRMSGWHQVLICALAIGVALVGLVPIELHRRIVNLLVAKGEVQTLWFLGVVYFAILLVWQSLNWLLKVYQGWLSESATYRTRDAMITRLAEHKQEYEDDAIGGQSITVVGAETDQLGGFVGAQVSQAMANVAILLGVIIYMFVIAPWIALYSLGFLLPQLIIAPLVQSWLNQLVRQRLELMRQLGDELPTVRQPKALDTLLCNVYSNSILFQVVKSTMKATLNLINHLAPLIVLVLGGLLVLRGQEEVGTLVAFVSGYQRIAAPVRELIQFYRSFAQTGVQHDMIIGWPDQNYTKS